MGLSISLGELAEVTGAELHGDADCIVTHVDTIQDAGPGAISFLANSTYRKYLPGTRASAVILGHDHLAECPGNALVCEHPYLVYAQVATLLAPPVEQCSGIHPSAVVAAGSHVHATAWIGPCAVVEAECDIGAGVSIGPGCFIGRGCKVGDDSRLVANIALCAGTQIGRRALVHPGVVIGSDGFGLANDNGVWKKVPQMGRVRIGDDVEIGANTTIDRGALRDTVIGSGVKLDNQIQIAHNVTIGENTAIAGCAGIAGSTTIGKQCTIGGGVGVVGHLTIGDNVHISAQTLVTRSFRKAGYYSGNLPAVPNGEWRRSIARVRNLDDIMARVKRLERSLRSASGGDEPDDE